MDPSYETVVDPATIVPTALAMGAHGLFAALQLALAGYLLVTGLRGVASSVPGPRLGSSARIGLSLAIVLPLAVGAPSIVSLLGCLCAGGLLLTRVGRGGDHGIPAHRLRQAALAAAAAVSGFMLFEGEDSLDLAVALVVNMNEWRTHELEWQLEHDLQAPKVGDLAPDFTLQDPSGTAVVRLSDFRGRRPVALVFGSYT